jgi:hypothetical protein
MMTIPKEDECSVVDGFLCDRRGGYEDAFPGTLTLQCTGKFSHLQPACYTVRALRLAVDDIQVRPVLFDYAVAGLAP